METQPCFNLNAALESWRNELAAQPELSADDRRELEKHLADSMAELRQRGLSEEEAYWLARRRIGAPQQLAEEFQKADPQKVWRERLFWIWLGFFAWTGFNRTFDALAFAITYHFFHYGVANLFVSLATYLVPMLILLMLVVLLAKGKLIPQFSKLMPLIRNRRRLAKTMFIVVALLVAAQLAEVVEGRFTSEAFFLFCADAIIRNTIFGLVLLWLMPVNDKKRPA